MPKYEVTCVYLVDAYTEGDAKNQAFCHDYQHFMTAVKSVREIKPRYTVRAYPPDHRTSAWLLKDGEWLASFLSLADARMVADYMNSGAVGLDGEG